MPVTNMGDDMERQSAQFPIDNIALKKLCWLLKNKADNVLNGKASFTLTTEVLNRLNEDCRRHSFVQSDNDREAAASPEINSWRPFRRVMANLKKSNQKKEQEEEWGNNIQFVKDFMLSTPNLKIIHKHGTLSFPISLKRFGNLSVLEIRKVPVHLIEGLQTIRGTLESLAIDRSVTNLKDLLESCGSDRSAPLTWAKLKVLSLVFNDIHSLDESLRLVSHLEKLDLSHNRIEATGKFLENLVDVLLLTLAYNRLTSIPSFSITTRKSLTSLVLRGNQLDNVQGVETLTSLEMLDLGENYLVDHFVLLPLKALHRLRRLSLDRNPLFYHKHHRRLTVCHLSSRVISNQFFLDNKRLSGSEILAYNPHIVLRTSPRMWMGSDIEARMSSPSLFPTNRPQSASSGIGTSENSPEIIATSTPKKNGKRRRLKARNTEIRDLEVSGEYSSSVDATPRGSPSARNLERLMQERREEALRTQREVEKLREDYGPNWLQAMQDRNIFKQSKPTTTNSATETESDGRSSRQSDRMNFFAESCDEIIDNSESNRADETYESGTKADLNPEEEDGERSNRHPTHDDLYLTDTIVNPANNPIMAAIAKLASGQKTANMGEESEEVIAGNCVGTKTSSSSSSSAAETGKSNGVVNKDNETGKGQQGGMKVKGGRSKLQGSDPDDGEIGHMVVGKESNKETSGDKNSKLSNVVASPPSQAEGKVQTVLSPKRKLFAEEQKDVKEGGQSITSPERSESQSLDQSTSEMDSSTDNSLQISQNEHESEPIFVTLPEAKDTMMIITFTELFIVEKDVRGKIKEKLDIRSVVNMGVKKMKKRKSSDTLIEGQGVKDTEEEKTTPMMRMVLKFSYVRKDRQRRCYLMDVQDGEALRKHLQLSLDTKEEESKKKELVILQCLKCNRSFQKKDLVHRSKQLPQSGSSKDLKALKEMIDTPKLICPKCGSSILIEMESSPPSKTSAAGSTTSTPTGSYSSTGSYMDNRHQLMQQQQQHQQPSPRKPAPMLRNRSFDHHSPQASLAARVARARKFSLTSADNPSFPRRGNPAPSSSPANQSRAGSLTESRDRSNAFTATGQVKVGSGSFTKEKTSSVNEEEELLHIEDHFGADGMSSSQQLALVTSSLREDNSSVGSRTSSLKTNEKEDVGDKDDRTVSKDIMSDSGIESGVYSSGLSQQKEQTGISEEKSSNSKETNYSDQSENVDKEKDKSGKTEGGESEKGKEKENGNKREREKNKRSGSNISAEHKNLATMADLVNSLVTEGRNLEEKEMQKRAETQSLHSLDEERSRSISVSELKRYFPVVSTQRNSGCSIDSDIQPLHTSQSGSSIATLNAQNENGDEVSKSIEMRTSSSARFVIGSFENSHEELMTGAGLSAVEVDGESIAAGVRSPLSSSICNSMISSIYENVVTDEVVDGNNERSGHVPLGPRSSGDSAGSEILRVDEVEEEENMLSIYDRPKQPKATKRKSSKNKKTKTSSTNQTDSSTLKEKSSEEKAEEDEECKRSLAYSSMLDQISASDGFHPKHGSQSSFADQIDSTLYGDPESSENLYGSPAMHADYGHDDNDNVGDEGEDDTIDEDEEENFLDGGAAGSEVTYRFERLDHRLTLHLMMNVFENQEEFQCKISCECVGYMVEESYPSLLLISSNRFYILKVADHEPSEEPAKWLSCVEVQPIPELRYIDVGLGGQSLRLEFLTDCSSYSLVTRNRNKTLQFVEVLHNHLAHYAVTHGITSNVVVNEDVDQVTLNNLDTDVLSKVIPDQPLLLYIMGFIERGYHKKFPISFVVSPSEVCLVRANHQWPQPRLQAPISVDTSGKQFTVLERQRINNIASVEVCELTLKRIRLELFNEMEGVSSVWNITMASKQGTYDFIHAISEPWAREFGVDMDVSYSILDFGK